jgi:beta-barrel assembly-enhancing protease
MTRCLAAAALHPHRHTMKTKNYMRSSLAAWLLCSLSACQTTPVPGRLEQPAQLLDARDERALIATAMEIDRRIAAREELTGERKLDEYLQLLTERLLLGLEVPDGVALTARSLKTHAPDVFVLANGSLYVSQGAMARLDNPSQLAALIGREVLHYVNRDQLRAQRKELNYRREALLPQLLLITVTAGLAGLPLERSINNAVNGYSEQLEQQTDAALIALLPAAGFLPDQAPAAYRALLLTSPDRGTSFGTKLTRELLLQQRIGKLEAALASSTVAPLAVPQTDGEAWTQRLLDIQLRLVDDAFVRRDYPFATLVLDKYERIAAPTGRVPYLRALLAQRSATGYGGDERALTEFSKATGFADCPVDAWRELGLILRRRGESARAADAFRSYLAKRPNASDAVFIRSYLVSGAGSMIRPILLVSILWLPLLALPAHGSEDPGWRVERTATMQQVKRVGMLPATDEAGVERPEALQALQRMVREQLEIAGFTVIGPEAYTAIRKPLLEQLGGIYDARTGALADGKKRALEAQVRRSFLEQHQLDALLLTEIQVRKAFVNGQTAYWDGVSDRAAGPSRGFLKELIDPAQQVEGSMSALSLVLVLYGVNGEVLYAYPGGIELLAYTARTEFGGFRYVPTDALLRDEPRMQRAAEAATLFLRKSQAQMDAEAKALKDAKLAYAAAIRARREAQRPVEPPKPEPLPKQPEAPGADEIDPFKKPRDAILGSVKRVVIAPLSAEAVPDEAAARRRYEQLLTEQMERLGWQVVSSSRYVELLVRERLKEESASFDVYTGARLGNSLETLRERALAQLVAEDQPIDAIVYADIVRTSAPHQAEDAKWDGIKQNAVDLGTWKKRGFFEGTQLTGFGRMPALSLRLLIVDRNNEVLFVNRGGIQLLRQVINRKLEPVPQAQVLTAPEHDVEAVRVALRPLLLTPEQLDAELNPEKARKKERERKQN